MEPTGASSWGLWRVLVIGRLESSRLSASLEGQTGGRRKNLRRSDAGESGGERGGGEELPLLLPCSATHASSCSSCSEPPCSSSSHWLRGWFQPSGGADRSPQLLRRREGSRMSGRETELSLPSFPSLLAINCCTGGGPRIPCVSSCFFFSLVCGRLRPSGLLQVLDHQPPHEPNCPLVTNEQFRLFP